MRWKQVSLMAGWLALGVVVGTLSAPPATAQGVPKVCENGTVVGAPIKGGAKLGRYAGVTLPASFANSRDETHVTAEIYGIFIMRKDWACFQSHFPEAEKIFEAHVKQMGGGH
jgi:hypothetical protein